MITVKYYLLELHPGMETCLKWLKSESWKHIFCWFLWTHLPSQRLGQSLEYGATDLESVVDLDNPSYLYTTWVCCLYNLMLCCFCVIRNTFCSDLEARYSDLHKQQTVAGYVLVSQEADTGAGVMKWFFPPVCLGIGLKKYLTEVTTCDQEIGPWCVCLCCQDPKPISAHLNPPPNCTCCHPTHSTEMSSSCWCTHGHGD